MALILFYDFLVMSCVNSLSYKKLLNKILVLGLSNDQETLSTPVYISSEPGNLFRLYTVTILTKLNSR